MQRAVDVLFKNRSVDYDKVEIHFVQRNVRVGFRKDEKPVARDFGRKIIFRTVARQRYGFFKGKIFVDKGARDRRRGGFHVVAV